MDDCLREAFAFEPEPAGERNGGELEGKDVELELGEACVGLSVRKEWGLLLLLGEADVCSNERRFSCLGLLEDDAAVITIDNDGDEGQKLLMLRSSKSTLNPSYRFGQ